MDSRYFNQSVSDQDLKVFLKGYYTEIIEPSNKSLDLIRNLWHVRFPVPKSVDAIWDFRLNTRNLDQRFIAATLFIDGYPVSRITRAHEQLAGGKYMQRYSDGSLVLRFFDGPMLTRMLFDHELHIVIDLNAIQPQDVELNMHYGIFNRIQIRDYMNINWNHTMRNAQGKPITFQFINGTATIIYPPVNKNEKIVQFHRHMNPIVVAVDNQWSMPNETTIRL